MSETRENRRSAILQAACKEFSEKGFSGAKIEEIAHQCGIGKSTVYEYFPSKTDLLRETAGWMMDRVTVDVEGLMEGRKSFADKTRAYLLYMCRLMQRLGHGLLYMHGNNKEILEVIQKCTREFFLRLNDVAVQAVRLARQNGELRGDLDESAMAGLVLNLPSPLLAEQLASGGAKVLDDMVELVMHGMAAK